MNTYQEYYKTMKTRLLLLFDVFLLLLLIYLILIKYPLWTTYRAQKPYNHFDYPSSSSISPNPVHEKKELVMLDGTFTLVGNDPFIKIILTTLEGNTYFVKNGEVIENKLNDFNGKTVRIEGYLQTIDSVSRSGRDTYIVVKDNYIDIKKYAIINPYYEIIPTQALIIRTDDSWGHITNQTIVNDVTSLIARHDFRTTRVEEIDNPSDSFDRFELYVSFPAKNIDGLSGYYVVRFTPGSTRNNDGFFELDNTMLIKKKQDYFLLTTIKSNSDVKTALLYSRKPQIVYVETEDLRTFFNAYAYTLHNNYIQAVASKNRDDSFHTINLAIDPLFRRQGWRIDKAQEILQGLDDQFHEYATPFIWNGNKISQTAISNISEKLIKEKLLPDFNLRLQYGKNRMGLQYSEGRIIAVKDMIPTMERRILIKEDNKSVVGAVSITVLK